MKEIDTILENESDVLGFLRSRYPIYHQSNVFFRDIQYGIQAMLERKGVRVRYTDAEHAAREFIGRLEKKKMLVPIDGQSWVVRNEEFKTVPAKKSAPAKPAAASAATARPAGGLPPLKSATPAGGAKPAGLPPLKSSAPAAGATPAAELPPLKSSAPAGGKTTAAPAQPKEEPKATPAAAAEPEPKTAPAPKQKAPVGKKGELPPITSSVPAGAKK